jgi:uncharacterized protein (TIGR03435 family)
MYMFERMPDHMRGRWGGRNITIASLANALTHVPFAGAPVDRPVVDETGLNGTFDFKVEYAPQSQTPAAGGFQRPGEPARPAANEVEPDPDGPTFLNGLHEQLGLKLTSAKGQARIPVIDHVEKPSEN